MFDHLKSTNYSKGLHKGVVRGHFATNITIKKFWMQIIGGQFYSRYS
jgi:hypothetical protein